MLGREVSAQTYRQMEAQLRDTGALDLTGDAFERLSDAGIAELIRMPGLKDTLNSTLEIADGFFFGTRRPNGK